MNTRKSATRYSVELAQEICDAIATSSLGLKNLCSINNHWPDVRSIYRWISTKEDFAEQYSRSKQFQCQILFDEIIEISDDSSKDTFINAKGERVTDHENINRSRLRVDSRKWVVAKLCPHKYGDRIQNDTNVLIKQENALKELE